MSPPELPTDTPFMQIFHNSLKYVTIASGNNLKFFICPTCHDFLREFFTIHKPLRRNNRLNADSSSLRIPDLRCVGSDFHEISTTTEHLYHHFSCFEFFFSCKYARVFHHHAVIIEDTIIEREIMSFCCFKICRIMSGRNLYRTSSEIHIDHFISDNGNLSICDGEYGSFPYEFLVSFVLWMHSDSLICEESLGASRCDDEFFVSARDKIGYLIEKTRLLSVLDFRL